MHVDVRYHVVKRDYGLDRCCLEDLNSEGRIKKVLPAAQKMLEQFRQMNVISSYLLICFSDDAVTYNLDGRDLPDTMECIGNTNTTVALNQLQGIVNSDYKTIAVMFTDGIPCSSITEVIWDEEEIPHFVFENSNIEEDTLNALKQLKKDTRVDLTTAITLLTEEQVYAEVVHSSGNWEAFDDPDFIEKMARDSYEIQSGTVERIFGTYKEPSADRLYVIDDDYISSLFAKEIINDTIDSFISIEKQASYGKDDMITRALQFSKLFSMDNKKAESLAGIRGAQALEDYSKMIARTDNIELLGNNTHLEELNMGLVERPKVDLSITEEVESIKITLSDGTILIDTSEDLTKNLFNWGLNRIGPIHAYMDKEIMQGATITVKYGINVVNNSEFDSLSNYFGTDNSEMTTSAVKIYSYVSSNMIFREEENNGLWELETNYNELNNEVIKEINDNRLAVIKTTNQISNVTLTSGQQMSFPLVLSKIISSETDSEDLVYTNYVEIVVRGNILGRRSYTQIPGNFRPISKINFETDSDISDSVTILPPFGENRNNSLKYIVSILALIIITVFLSRILLTFRKKKDKIYK